MEIKTRVSKMKHTLISKWVCTVLTSSKRSKCPPVQEECGSTEVDTVDGTDKRRYPPNWLAEIEVPLGMKYVLSSHISKYRRLFWTGNYNYFADAATTSFFSLFYRWPLPLNQCDIKQCKKVFRVSRQHQTCRTR